MIRRLSFLTVILSLAYSLNASHVRGGEITWECQGSNSYIFTLTLYTDCIPPSVDPITSSIDGPNGAIYLSLVSKNSLDELCHDPSASYACWGTLGTNASEVLVYRSDTIVLNGTPPATGWVFNYNICCRNAGLINISSPQNEYIDISSVMYPDGSGQCHDSPSFVGLPRAKLLPGEFDASMMAIKPEPGDSLYYEFISPVGSNGQPVSFVAGYSAAAPFPDGSEDPQNGSVTLDPTSGLIEASVHSAGNTPNFQYALRVQCWRDNQLVSAITRDMIMTLADNSPAAATNPGILIDTAGLRPKHNHPVLTSNNRIEIVAFPGDTVHFTMQSFDPDMISGTMGEEITFSAQGYSLGSVWPGGGNNSYSSLPTIAPVAPQSSFSNESTNTVSFSWVIGAEHLTGTKTSHIFNFSFKDDGCPSVRVNNLTAEIKVMERVSMLPDTLFLCEQDSVRITGAYSSSNTYSWSPATGLSDTTAAEPWVKASTSRYYYFTDPLNPSNRDSVYVQVEQNAAFHLGYNNGLLTLTDSVNSGAEQWYFNNIPFNYPHDTLTPLGSGLYKVVSTTDFCKYFSNEVYVPHNSFSLSDTSTGQVSDDLLVLTDTMGIVFRIDSGGTGGIVQVLIPGIVNLSGKSGGNALHISIQNDQHQVVWGLDTLVDNIGSGIFKAEVDLDLMIGQEYTLRILGDTSLAFHYLENVQVPFRPWNGGLEVSGLFEDTSATGPLAQTDRMIPVVLKVERQNIGREELPVAKVKVYPNPAKDKLHVGGWEEEASITIRDISGKTIFKKELKEGQSIDVSNWHSGLYVIVIQSKGRRFAQKLVIEP